MTTTKGQSLTFMDGDSPCQSYGKLGEGAQHFFFNFFFFFVVFIANVFPVLRLDVTFFPIISDDIERFFYLIETTDYTDSAVYPAAVEIILDKYDLCTGFSTSSREVGRLLSGKSPVTSPRKVTASPGSSASFRSLI